MIFQAVVYYIVPEWAVVGHNGVCFGGVLAKVGDSPVEHVTSVLTSLDSKFLCKNVSIGW
jgi:hypothetical protein